MIAVILVAVLTSVYDVPVNVPVEEVCGGVVIDGAVVSGNATLPTEQLIRLRSGSSVWIEWKKLRDVETTCKPPMRHQTR